MCVSVASCLAMLARDACLSLHTVRCAQALVHEVVTVCIGSVTVLHIFCRPSSPFQMLVQTHRIGGAMASTRWALGSTVGNGSSESSRLRYGFQHPQTHLRSHMYIELTFSQKYCLAWMPEPQLPAPHTRPCRTPCVRTVATPRFQRRTRPPLR